MKKVRIYEYAKEVGKQSKDLITVLKDANIDKIYKRIPGLED